MGAQKIRLNETVLLSTHNICFISETIKILFCYALLSGGLIIIIIIISYHATAAVHEHLSHLTWIIEKSTCRTWSANAVHSCVYKQLEFHSGLILCGDLELTEY